MEQSRSEAASAAANATRAGSRIRGSATSGVCASRHAKTAGGLTGLTTDIASADGRAAYDRAANGYPAGSKSASSVATGGITAKCGATGAIATCISISMSYGNGTSGEALPNGARAGGAA